MKLRMREQGLKNHGIACIQFVRSHQLPRLDSILNWAQRDSNPRPTAPQAAILSKLNYEPDNSIDDVASTKYELTPT